jgi:hypothetical protein
VGDEFVDFLEGVRVEKKLDALAGGQLSGRPLPLKAFGAAAKLGTALEIV